MSVSSAASTTNSAALQGLYQQRKNDFKTMASDVQSGDLSGAQSALTALQQISSGNQGNDIKQPSRLQTDFANLVSSIQGGSLNGAKAALGALQQPQASNGVAAAPAQSGFGQDLTSLIQAIQSGNAAGAQQDVTQLQSDMKSQGGRHHHYHDAMAAGNAASTANNPVGTQSGAGTSASAYAAMMNLQASASLMTAEV